MKNQKTGKTEDAKLGAVEMLDVEEDKNTLIKQSEVKENQKKPKTKINLNKTHVRTKY